MSSHKEGEASAATESEEEAPAPAPLETEEVLNPVSKRKKRLPLSAILLKLIDGAETITLRKKFIVSCTNTWQELTGKALEAWLPSSVAGLHKVATSGGVFAKLQARFAQHPTISFDLFHSV